MTPFLQFIEEFLPEEFMQVRWEISQGVLHGKFLLLKGQAYIDSRTMRNRGVSN